MLDADNQLIHPMDINFDDQRLDDFRRNLRSERKHSKERFGERKANQKKARTHKRNQRAARHLEATETVETDGSTTYTDTDGTSYNVSADERVTTYYTAAGDIESIERWSEDWNKFRIEDA